MPIWRAQPRIDNGNGVADLGQFLKPLNGLDLPINLLLIDIYLKQASAFGLQQQGEIWLGRNRFGEHCGRENMHAFLVGIGAKSDAHGHDDVAITVRLVGQRTHLAGGLFVF